jgi:flavin reductase (DIM6/NTAB) family NADH-FMN oxidoreductase RutF
MNSSTSSKFRTFDLQSLSVKERYQFLTSAIVPRPIAWISTQDASGRTNLAPFSYFNAVSSDPPTLVISIARKPSGEKKDTLLNIEFHREFVVNLAPVELAEKVALTGIELPYGESEFTKAGLTPLPAQRIRAPRLAEAKVSLECKLLHLLEVGSGGKGSSTLVVGEVVWVHVREDLVAEQSNPYELALEALDPLSRLGGPHYGRAPQKFEIPKSSSRG